MGCRGTQSLLGGEDTFHFNNPVAQLWTDMKEGLLHPRLVKYRDGLVYLQEIKHCHTYGTRCCAPHHMRICVQLPIVPIGSLQHKRRDLLTRG